MAKSDKLPPMKMSAYKLDKPKSESVTEAIVDEMAGEPDSDYIFVKKNTGIGIGCGQPEGELLPPLKFFKVPVVQKPVSKTPKKGELRKDIWRVTSFYVDEQSTWQQVLQDAKLYAASANVNRTMTVAHKHFLGQNCNKACKGF